MNAERDRRSPDRRETDMPCSGLVAPPAAPPEAPATDPLPVARRRAVGHERRDARPSTRRAARPRGCRQSMQFDVRCDRCGQLVKPVHAPEYQRGFFCPQCCPVCNAAARPKPRPRRSRKPKHTRAAKVYPLTVLPAAWLPLYEFSTYALSTYPGPVRPRRRPSGAPRKQDIDRAMPHYRAGLRGKALSAAIFGDSSQLSRFAREYRKKRVHAIQSACRNRVEREQQIAPPF